MVAVNAFDLPGKRDQEGQFAAVGLIVTRQQVIDERSGLLRCFKTGHPLERLQLGEQFRR